MKKILCLAIVIATGLSVTSCGVSTNMTSNRNVTQTNVELNQRNYKVTKTAEGTERASYVIGIGGLSKKTVASNSYDNMVKDANLTGSQAIVNPTTQTKMRGFFPIYWRVETKTYGQVVEFDK